ncbi:hypothetical protein [Fastidiosibacter lacustris]|uniref:hypothetical protein n=1 Tax=Fastidiosibacter lacustris TaxID=2056695 RepID=UPI0013002F34|nr:hypothetical protein [Fastidiosibacter lacustris]
MKSILWIIAIIALVLSYVFETFYILWLITAFMAVAAGCCVASFVDKKLLDEE